MAQLDETSPPTIDSIETHLMPKIVDLRGNLHLPKQVVRVEKLYGFAPRFDQAEITRCGGTSVFLTKVTQLEMGIVGVGVSPLFDHFLAVVRRAVVHNDEFYRSVSLLPDTIHGFRHQMSAVVGGDDDGHQSPLVLLTHPPPMYRLRRKRHVGLDANGHARNSLCPSNIAFINRSRNRRLSEITCVTSSVIGKNDTTEGEDFSFSWRAAFPLLAVNLLS